MGFIIVMVVGMLISCVSGMQNSKLLDPRLVFKFIRKHVGSNRVTKKYFFNYVLNIFCFKNQLLLITGF